MCVCVYVCLCMSIGACAVCRCVTSYVYVFVCVLKIIIAQLSKDGYKRPLWCIMLVFKFSSIFRSSGENPVWLIHVCESIWACMCMCVPLHVCMGEGKWVETRDTTYLQNTWIPTKYLSLLLCYIHTGFLEATNPGNSKILEPLHQTKKDEGWGQGKQSRAST